MEVSTTSYKGYNADYSDTQPHHTHPATMPKSKRQRVTTLSKTPGRTTKASKLALVNEIRENVDKYEHVWLFSVGDMRNEGLKDVRAQWRGTGRFFFGKTRVMAKALGVSAETEYEEGIGAIGRVSRERSEQPQAASWRQTASCWASANTPSQQLKGQIGIFCTSHPVSETVEWFETWSKKEYARQGAKATADITLPEGALLTPWNEDNNGDPFPHSMDPQLRALGLDTSLVRGVPSLKNAHVLCRTGEKLSSEKCRILKLLAVQMAVSGREWLGVMKEVKLTPHAGVQDCPRLALDKGRGIRCRRRARRR